MKKLGLLFSILISKALFAENFYQPENFELADLKLGMNEEVKKALSARFPNEKINQMNGSHPEDFKIKMPDMWSVQDEKQRIVVYFSANYLNNRDKEAVVSAISFGLPDTDENRALLRKTAIEKYGEPTIGEKNSSLMLWCGQLRKVGVENTCATNEDPSLTFNRNLSKEIALYLQNPLYKKAIQKASEDKKQVKELKL